jgi:ribonuclease HI
MPYYAVHKGRNGPAIYNSWPDCQKSIKDFHGAIFKKFDSIVDAEKFKAEGFGSVGGKPKFIQKREDYETKNKDEIETVFTDENAHKNLIIYTDGSCIRDNGSDVKKVYCGYGIVIPELNIKIAEDLKDKKLTNNRAEMRAILHSIELLSEEVKAVRRLCIFTDSQYCKYIFQGTGERYEKANFIKEGEEVPNKDMIITALSYLRKYNIVILKVRAHTEENDIHSKYNDIADKLANEGAMKMKMGKSYKGNKVLENLEVYHDSILHPFEKREVKRAFTPQIEYVENGIEEDEIESAHILQFDNSYRYNDKRDWREEEKKKFIGKTKLNEIFETQMDYKDNTKSAKSAKDENENIFSVKIIKNKTIKFKNTSIGDFLSTQNVDKEEISKKEEKKKSSKKVKSSMQDIFHMFTDE